jgi:D-proline reductase (dithiol) PrdB
MTVDSFKFLPRLIATFYQMTERTPDLPVPWSPLTKPVSDCKFSLVTSGGLYVKTNQDPFDVDRERKEPRWGDPSYRTIPMDIRPSEVAVSHLHVNTTYVEQDMNVLLPVNRMLDLVRDGAIGSVAQHAYSFMGYQGYPPDTSTWESTYAPRMIDGLHAEGVDCVLLTPS